MKPVLFARGGADFFFCLFGFWVCLVGGFFLGGRTSRVIILCFGKRKFFTGTKYLLQMLFRIIFSGFSWWESWRMVLGRKVGFKEVFLNST